MMAYENPPLKRIIRSKSSNPLFITDLGIKLNRYGDEIDALQIQFNGKYYRTLTEFCNSSDLDLLLRSNLIEIEDEDGNIINGTSVDPDLRSSYLATLWDILNSSGSGLITIKGNSISLGDFDTLNFTGSGVVVTDGGSGQANIAISGGGGGSGTSLTKEVNQISHGFSIGEAVYFDGSEWLKAIASGSDTLGIGIVSSVDDGDNCTITFTGIVSGLSGLVAGEYYFVSTTTPGGLTSTKPVSGYENPILFATDTTEGIVFAYRPSEVGSDTISFTDLDDAPASYSGYGGYLVKVKDDESGLEFIGDDTMLAQRINFISDDEYYTGTAPAGSATSASVWRIKKTVVDSGGEGDVTVTWADGNANFDNVWNNHLSLSYS